MRRSPESNTNGRRALNVPRASVTGGHRRSLTRAYGGATTGMEAFPKLRMPCPQGVPADPDLAIRSHHQPGGWQWLTTAAVTSRYPHDSLVMRRSVDHQRPREHDASRTTVLPLGTGRACRSSP